MVDSRVSGYYRKSMGERIAVLVERGLLDAHSAQLLRDGHTLLPAGKADAMIENVIGVFGLPFAVIPDFPVNGKRYFVPMVVEEPSIVAGVNGAAKLFSRCGGISATGVDPLLVGQIQLPGVDDPEQTINTLRLKESEILRCADELQPNLVARGGGTRGIEYHRYQSRDGAWNVVVHILVDTRDAMGANAVNTMCEGIAPLVESLAGVNTGLKILSNLADRALVTATVTVPLRCLHENPEDARVVRDAIVAANEFAIADPYRAATHNKGIMNGVDAVAIATGTDWRSLEAGAHAYAARDGRYKALTDWSVAPGGELCGELCLPLKIGVVGASLEANPAAQAGLMISNAGSSVELAELMAAVGLAQNFAAIKALATDGIQQGHMKLHARSVAASIDTPPAYFEQVVAGMVKSGDVKQWKARELLERLTSAAARHDERAGSEAFEGRAAGKVILLGEHAVVYDKHALALPLHDAVVARVRDANEEGVHLSVPDWNIEQRFLPATQPEEGAAALLSFVMSRLGILERGLHIEVRSRIPAGTGLGSSASLAVAIVRALSNMLELGLEDEAVNEIAFECEKIAHGDPSGIDNTLAVYGQPILFRRSNEPPFESLQLAEVPPLVIATGKTRGSTITQVAGVRERYEAGRAMFDGVFEQIDALSISGAEALEAQDYSSLGSIMNVCHGMLNALLVSTVELEQMIHIARSNGALGAKLTGAGGGGAIVALCPGTTLSVSRALRSAGYTIVQTCPERES
jgi:hydroxymethylglutaryl-CoA reductase